MVMRLVPLVAACLLLAGCSQSTQMNHDAPSPDPATGEVPLGPSWSFTDIDGQVHSRDSSLGQPSLLFFMATWCSKCQALAPRLADVQDDFADRGLQAYTLSWDPQEDARDLRDWKAHYKQDWPHGLDTGSRIAQTFDITSQSSIVVLDGNGNPVRTWIYANPSAADLRSAIDAAYERT